MCRVGGYALNTQSWTVARTKLGLHTSMLRHVTQKRRHTCPFEDENKPSISTEYKQQFYYGALNKFPDWIFRALTERSYHTSR